MKIVACVAFGAGTALGAIDIVRRLAGPYAFEPRASDAIWLLLTAIVALLITKERP